MTHEAPVNPDPAAIKDHTLELYQQAREIGDQADLEMARSEILRTIAAAHAELDSAEAGLIGARQQLADATKAYEIPASDLAAVESALAEAQEPDPDLPLAERVARRAQRIALEEELARLQEIAADRKVAAMTAADLVAHYERDNLPDRRAGLAVAQAAYDDPPLSDFSKLVLVAPGATIWRTGRLGVALLTGNYVSTQHFRLVKETLTRQLAASGLLAELHSEWLQSLVARLDQKTSVKVRIALGLMDHPLTVPVQHDALYAQHRALE
jgi:hypothetical protein